MYLPFECKACRKDKWMVRYDTELNNHKITCANCGHSEIQEEIFGSRRKVKNVKNKGKVTRYETPIGVEPKREEIKVSESSSNKG